MLSKKMEELSSAIFTELSLRKCELLEKHMEVIDFSIGTPDMPPSPRVIQTLLDECKDLNNYKYAINDSPELIASVIQWYEKRYGVTLKEDEIVSLLGSQSGFAELALALIDPGDTVLVPDPGYPVFSIGPLLAGAKLFKMPLKKENNYIIDLDAIPEQIAIQTKLMVVSYPNNPTASIASKEFYLELISFAKKYDIIVLHDNAYSELIFSDTIGESFLSLPGAKDVGIEFNSLSKTYSIPGCRIAFALGNKKLITGLKTIKSHVDYGMFIPFQKVAVELLSSYEEDVSNVRETYRQRRDLLVNGLNQIGWKIDLSQGSMFVWAAIPPKYSSSVDFTFDLMEKTGVIVVPGISFGDYGEGYVRIALVQEESLILKAIENIKNSNIL
jgi:LL-diaminopimelate aminotransferase